MRSKNDVGLFSSTKAEFKTHLKTKHAQFWNRYERPPKEEYWDYIIERRDLLVPQNLREYQGAFFTPRIWVEKSQEYLAKTLGESYQEEYYIWDLAAGTGNLLVGLSDKYKIYASTLYKSDVDVMIQRIQRANLNLLESNVFVFDFLNDPLPCVVHKQKNDLCFNCRNFDENTTRLPQSLVKILKDSKKREKLIIFINPPYAEAASATTATQKAAQDGENKNKAKVATDNATYLRYKDSMGNASNEIFAQFFFRIYNEIPHCNLAAFSTLKYINSSNFIKFRETFKARFLGGFVCPAYTFDNVKGKFPIGFLVWNLKSKDSIKSITLDVYNEKNEFMEVKKFSNYDDKKFINQWYAKFYDNTKEIGVMNTRGNDFQNQNYIRITSDNNHNHTNAITPNNLIPTCIYLAVRHAIKATWLNDRDQFLYPHDSWESDAEFQNDCLAFTLFHWQNRITSKADSTNQYTNHFIPFRESEVDSRETFESHFMSDFIGGKMAREESQNTESKTKKPQELDLFETESKFIPTKPLVFSNEAKAVFEAGKALYRYYHANFGKIPEIHHDDEFYRIYQANASLYDIKGYFQGFKNGRMNARSLDSVYNDLMANLRYALEKLAKKIEPKIYDYGFLLE